MKSLLLILVLAVGSTYAGGSDSFTGQVLPILQQDKKFADALLKSFEFNKAVWARTRMGSHTKFGGQRLGPYTVLARPKESQGPWVFEVTIKTKHIVYDDNGNEMPLIDEAGKKTGAFLDPKATRMTETFVSFEIKPHKENDSNHHLHSITASGGSE